MDETEKTAELIPLCASAKPTLDQHISNGQNAEKPDPEREKQREELTRGLTPKDALVEGGKTFEITGIKELGRRDFSRSRQRRGPTLKVTAKVSGFTS